MEGRQWDKDALRKWEDTSNGGAAWEGREDALRRLGEAD